MTGPTITDIYEVIDTTWQPASKTRHGPWMIREGRGAGGRVSSATAEAPVIDADIPIAEEAMRAFGQTPLFMIRDGETALDQALEARGYRIKDAVHAYAAPIGTLAADPPPVTCFEVWPPLEIMKEVWDAGGIGPERRAVMARVPDPKTTILGRTEDQPAGAAFVAIAGPFAMTHAVETLARHRRRGLAVHMMQAAARWAARHGATHMTLITTQDNIAANALYRSLGMTVIGGYHYRIHPEAP
ncbi:GNAT family N-acetyltransferase [Aestuariibius insulae]|uniref:GNAT family N-acetyltransferase n=1 Tax=Aestuariibius insulae TaxID=2058287 RepID=UPI00345E163C